MVGSRCQIATGCPLSCRPNPTFYLRGTSQLFIFPGWTPTPRLFSNMQRFNSTLHALRVGGSAQSRSFEWALLLLFGVAGQLFLDIFGFQISAMSFVVYWLSCSASFFMTNNAFVALGWASNEETWTVGSLQLPISRWWTPWMLCKRFLSIKSGRTNMEKPSVFGRTTLRFFWLETHLLRMIDMIYQI